MDLLWYWILVYRMYNINPISPWVLGHYICTRNNLKQMSSNWTDLYLALVQPFLIEATVCIGNSVTRQFSRTAFFSRGGQTPCVDIIYWAQTNTYKGKFRFQGGWAQNIHSPSCDTYGCIVFTPNLKMVLALYILIGLLVKYYLNLINIYLRIYYVLLYWHYHCKT